MNTYFCFGRNSEQLKENLRIALTSTRNPEIELLHFAIKYKLCSISMQALVLFKVLSYIEEKKEKEVTIYHATNIFPLNKDKHPQILSLMNKISRMEKIGYKIRFVHVFEAKKSGKLTTEHNNLWNRTRTMAQKNPLSVPKKTDSSNKEVKKETKTEKKCFCCKKTKPHEDFPFKKGTNKLNRWCKVCEESFKSHHTVPLCTSNGVYKKELKKEDVKSLIENSIIVKAGDVYRYKNKKSESQHNGKKKIEIPLLQKRRLNEIKTVIDKKYKEKMAIIDNHNLVIDFVSIKKANKLIKQGLCIQKSETSIQWVENKIKQEIHPLNYFNIKQVHQSNFKNALDFIFPLPLKNTVKIYDRDNEFCFRISKNIGKRLVEEGVAVYLDIWKNNIRFLYDQFDFNNYVKKRDRNKCVYCGQKGETVEHLVARFHGGLTTLENCTCACSKCNSAKGNKTMDEYLEGTKTQSV